MEQASELFRRNEDHELLSGLRAAGLGGEVQHAEQLTVQFAEHQEQLEEVGFSMMYQWVRIGSEIVGVRQGAVHSSADLKVGEKQRTWKTSTCTVLEGVRTPPSPTERQ